MTKALAKAKATERKTAEKRIRARSGVDTTTAPVVDLKLQSDQSSQSQEPNMTDLTPEQQAAQAKAAEKQAAIEAKAAAKAEKQAAQAAKKAEREAAAATKVAEAEAKKAERAAKKAERDAALAERAAALAESGRKCVVSMLSLADRVKSGAYVKGLNGQLRSNDDVAVALDAVPAFNVIKLILEVLNLESNPYSALNVGQQSMNLRNKLRGAISRGEVTIEKVIEIRDANGYATAEDEVAKKREAKAQREAAIAAKKAAKEAAAAARQAKKAEAAQAAA